jgi:archaellum biogenesis ATPase FlaH
MEVRLRYALQTTLIFWISNHGPENVSPTNLEMIANTISRFLKKSRNPVVLLDGIENMILANGSVPVLRFLRDVEEEIILNDAIFILPISPEAVEEKELALIERTMKEIDAKDEGFE